MDQYRLVENKNAIFTEKHENEVRLTGYGHITNYIEYTLKLLEVRKHPGTRTVCGVHTYASTLQIMGKPTTLRWMDGWVNE